MTGEIISRGSGDIKQCGVDEALAERFVAYLDVSPASARTYRNALRQMVAFFDETGAGGHPSREDLVEYRRHLYASGCKANTIQLYMTACRLFFRWTAQEGIYPNIADHLKGAKVSRDHKKDYFTSKQVKTILDTVDRSGLKGLRDYAVLALMVTDGLRTVEVARANVEDLRTRGNDTVLYIQGKGREDKAEFVKVSAPVEAAIRAYFKERGKVSGSDPLFASCSNRDAGGRMETRSISRLAKDAFRAAGFDSDRLTAHSLRHTAVTLSLLAGEEITQVQQFARHANIATTMIYNHALDAANNTCSAAISGQIF